MRQAGRAREGRERPLETTLPAVRAGDRAGGLGIGGGDRRQRAQPLTLARGRFERPRECGERAALRPALDLVRHEEAARLLRERARLAGRALVVGSLADEVEPPRRPRAGRVEEVAVSRDRVGPKEARSARGLLELGLPILVEERRALGPPRQAALLEAEDEDHLEAAGAGATEGAHPDAPPLPRAPRAKGRRGPPRGQ